jgi:hypothetical protein
MKNLAIFFSILIMTIAAHSQQTTSSSLGNFKKMKKSENGLSIETDFGKALVIVYNAGIVRIRIVKNDF